MSDPINKIYTRVKKAVSEKCSHTTQTFSELSSNLPCLYLVDIGSPEDGIDMDLGNDCENFIDCNIEIQVYTNGTKSLAKNKEIFSLADKEMRRMGFSRMYGVQKMDNLQDSKIDRLVARYYRKIGAGDTL